jgi:hypothetical protein
VKEYESYKLPKGRIDNKYISYRKGNKWQEFWYGTVREGNKTYKFTDLWEELIYSPRKLENSLKKTGFKILKIYGSDRAFSNFDKNKSWRRVYLCQK